MALPFDWSQINTALLVGTGAYLWRQARTVDAIRQALLGLNGKGEDGGLIAEMRMVRQRTHDLANVMTTLNITVGHLAAQLEELRTRPWDGPDRRREPGR